jgi:hypothetical protein
MRRTKDGETATLHQCLEASAARKMEVGDGRRSRMSATTSSGRDVMVVVGGGGGGDIVEVLSLRRLVLIFSGERRCRRNWLLELSLKYRYLRWVGYPTRLASRPKFDPPRVPRVGPKTDEVVVHHLIE